MENISSEQIITVSVLLLWFFFPMGMLISFMRQSNEQKYPKTITSPDSNHGHNYSDNKNFNSSNDEDYYEEDDYIKEDATLNYKIPKNINSDDHRNV